MIELLIVVAIIAVLALIALPNFMEARTRAKVSRVRADMRALATAIEAYRADSGAYPLPTGNGIPTRLWVLSTPVTYLARPRLTDAFGDQRSGEIIAHELEYWGANDCRTALATSASGEWIANRFGGGRPAVLWFFLRSSGPDNDVNSEGAGYETWLKPERLCDYLYDPTNGTHSFGQIFRVGGEPAPAFQPSATLVMRHQ